jgi:hypothetical protein
MALNYRKITNKLLTNEPLSEKEATDLRYYIVQSVDQFNRLCAWHDDLANTQLEKTDSYSAFDEPHAVKAAREFVSDHNIPRNI